MSKNTTAAGLRCQAAFNNSQCKHYNISPCYKQSKHIFLPSPAEYYEALFGQISKQSANGWAVARCCFHLPDRRPSLSINLNNGAYRCWSCGKKGRNIIYFHMELNGFDYKEAIQSLSRRG